MANSKKFSLVIDDQNNVKISFNANSVDASILNNISEIITKVAYSKEETSETDSAIIEHQKEESTKKETQQVIDVEDEDSLSENESQINNIAENADVELSAEELAKKLEDEKNSEYWKMLANDSVNYANEHTTNINSRALHMPEDKVITANKNQIEAIKDPMAFLQMPNFSMPTPEETQNFQMQTENTEFDLQKNENESQINTIEEPICSGAQISKSAFEQFFGLMDD